MSLSIWPLRWIHQCHGSSQTMSIRLAKPPQSRASHRSRGSARYLGQKSGLISPSSLSCKNFCLAQQCLIGLSLAKTPTFQTKTAALLVKMSELRSTWLWPLLSHFRWISRNFARWTEGKAIYSLSTFIYRYPSSQSTPSHTARGWCAWLGQFLSQHDRRGWLPHLAHRQGSASYPPSDLRPVRSLAGLGRI